MKLVDQAHDAGRIFTASVSRLQQKQLGQFMTPPTIARFMARRLVAGFNRDEVKLLDPAAGSGILAAAAVEELLVQPERPRRIELLLYEYDERLLPSLSNLVREMRATCAAADVILDAKVVGGDFLLSELALSGRPLENLLTISNPPFLKLNKATDARARVHGYAVYGQPNIYSLFMAACARLTASSGRWCFITPRSWMNGAYFTAARQTLLRHLTLQGLHAFESRSEGFEEDSVLQETVIAWATGRQTTEYGTSILLTRSQGAADLGTSEVISFPAERVVGDDPRTMVRIPHGMDDPFAGWIATLKTYGLEVSTGPVVAFRAEAFIREQPEMETVPFLWLQHVGQQEIRWPIKKKREHIVASAASAWMLVKNEPMVVMRRFSPKEDARRVTCAAYEGGLPGSAIGLENHLNYIYRPGGRMTVDEVRGLSAFLSSDMVDRHFRGLAGSTQVNATELRMLPLPPLSAIENIGQSLPASPALRAVDAAVSAALSELPRMKALA